MIVVAVTAALTIALAGFSLTRRRLLWGVVGIGAHSLMLAGMFLLLAAPDVALTEASIGFGLVTFVYLLALRRTGKLVVAAVPVYPLIYPRGERVEGLAWEVLQRLARELHRDLEVMWVGRAEVERMLASGEAHLAVGAILPREGVSLQGFPLLPTNLMEVRAGSGPAGAVRGCRGQDRLPREGLLFEDPEELKSGLLAGRVGSAIVDLLTLRNWHLEGMEEVEAKPIERGLHYLLLPSPTDPELSRAAREFVRSLKESGELETLIRRYLT